MKECVNHSLSLNLTFKLSFLLVLYCTRKMADIFVFVRVGLPTEVPLPKKQVQIYTEIVRSRRMECARAVQTLTSKGDRLSVRLVGKMYCWPPTSFHYILLPTPSERTMAKQDGKRPTSNRSTKCLP